MYCTAPLTTNNMQPRPISALTNFLHDETPPPEELEITILPLPGGYEYDDISFLKDGIHLGIHAPHVPNLAREFRGVYYAMRRSMRDSDIDRDTNGVDDVSYEYSFMDCISCLLLLCPDHATAWSDRKRELLSKLQHQHQQQQQHQHQHQHESSCCFWRKELAFLNLLFTQHSKAPNAWSHRRWICKQIIQDFKRIRTCQSQHHHQHYRQQKTSDESHVRVKREHEHEHERPSINAFFKWARGEIHLCIKIAEKYPKNYYAWTHRLFIVRTLVDMMNVMKINADDNGEQELEQEQVQDQDQDQEFFNVFHKSVCTILQSEIESIEPWLRKHVSDHSAAHYGGQVYALWLSVGGVGAGTEAEAEAPEEESSIRIHASKKWRMKELFKMYQSSIALMKKFPSHEVIWIWRRIVIFQIIHFFDCVEEDADVDSHGHGGGQGEAGQARNDDGDKNSGYDDDNYDDGGSLVFFGSTGMGRKIEGLIHSDIIQVLDSYCPRDEGKEEGTATATTSASNSDSHSDLCKKLASSYVLWMLRYAKHLNIDMTNSRMRISMEDTNIAISAIDACIQKSSELNDQGGNGHSHGHVLLHILNNM